LPFQQEFSYALYLIFVNMDHHLLPFMIIHRHTSLN